MSVDMEAFEACMTEQRERSRAAGKTGGAPTLKFEAEATAHLQRSGVPVTDDSPKSVSSLRQGLLCSPHNHDKEAHAHMHLFLLMRQCLGFSLVFIERWCCCRYQPSSIQTPVRAILSTSGFLNSTDAGSSGPLGIVLERTPFYAGMLLSSAVIAALGCAAWLAQLRSWQQSWAGD